MSARGHGQPLAEFVPQRRRVDCVPKPLTDGDAIEDGAAVGLECPREFSHEEKEPPVFHLRFAQVENLCYVKRAVVG